VVEKFQQWKKSSGLISHLPPGGWSTRLDFFVPGAVRSARTSRSVVRPRPAAGVVAARDCDRSADQRHPRPAPASGAGWAQGANH